MTVLLRGGLPGLLRRGCPVVLDGVPHAIVGHDGQGLLVTRADWTHGWAHAHVRAAPLADLHLDLTDEAGRDRAARWLAGRVGMDAQRGVIWRPGDPGRWFAEGERKAEGWERPGGCACCGATDAHTVPALAALNPNDPRLLPDGSRWVDAEALRVCCGWVGGER